MFDINSCAVRSQVISTEILFNNASIFGMCGLFLIQLSFSFRESSAIFTDLSFFTVITTGDTKQSSSKTVSLLSVQFSLVSLIPVLRLFVGGAVPV